MILKLHKQKKDPTRRRHFPQLRHRSSRCARTHARLRQEVCFPKEGRQSAAARKYLHRGQRGISLRPRFRGKNAAEDQSIKVFLGDRKVCLTVLWDQTCEVGLAGGRITFPQLLSAATNEARNQVRNLPRQDEAPQGDGDSLVWERHGEAAAQAPVWADPGPDLQQQPAAGCLSRFRGPVGPRERRSPLKHSHKRREDDGGGAGGRERLSCAHPESSAVNRAERAERRRRIPSSPPVSHFV